MPPREKATGSAEPLSRTLTTRRSLGIGNNPRGDRCLTLSGVRRARWESAGYSAFGIGKQPSDRNSAKVAPGNFTSVVLVYVGM